MTEPPDPKAAETRNLVQRQMRGRAELRLDEVADVDSRLLVDAARKLDTLAAQMNQVDQSLLVAFEELHEKLADDSHFQDMLDSVGFGYWPDTAAQFVMDFIGARSGTAGSREAT
jgi:hypothetical protein